MRAVGVFATALVTGLVLQPVFITWLHRRGVMDVPNARSSHKQVIPRGGGIAVGISLGLGLASGRQGGWDVAAVLGLGTLIGAIGLIDDFRSLTAKTRLGALLIIGAAAGLALSPPISTALAVPVMAVWIASYVNAFNFMDGINGISGISGLVAGVAYLLMGTAYDDTALIAIGGALAGASLAFLPFNVPRARVFLGDVGSYSLGFVIACSAWLVWSAGAPLFLALAPTSVYLADTGATLIRRARAGEPLTEAHRWHTYQRLVDGGCSHLATSVLTGVSATSVVCLVWAGEAAGASVVGILLAGAVLVGYLAAPSLWPKGCKPTGINNI